MMKGNEVPPGWNEERVRTVLKHYEEQTEDEAVAADEAALQDEALTVMEVPTALVTAIRELLAKYQPESDRGKQSPVEGQ